MLSFVAGLWAALSARGVPRGARGMVAVAGTVMLLGSALWAWRRQQARAAGASSSRAAVPCSIVARKAQLAIPEGLDGEQVLAAARGRFMRLQAAWDAGDVSTLKNLTTPEMLEELLHVLTERGAGTSRTDVITLHAELLGLEELSVAYLASVEFSGLIRERQDHAAAPFRELWLLANIKAAGCGWKLARVQSLS